MQWSCAEGDAGRLEEGHLEAHVVGDDAHAVEQFEDAGAGAVQINDEDAVAAVIDLQEPDAGAPVGRGRPSWRT